MTITSECDTTNNFFKDLLGSIDLVNSTVIPFVIMLISSLKIIHYLGKSRKKCNLNNSTKKDTRRLTKDMQFALTILFLDINFLAFNLPVSIVELSNVSDDFLVKFDYFFYTQYAFNFFVQLISNSLFRDEFLIFIGFRDGKKSIYRLRSTLSWFFFVKKFWEYVYYAEGDIWLVE